MHQSVSTLNAPEFINLQPLDINPLMESCDIKVLYVGANRNRSYITKEVASEMAKTLRGAPIVGSYKNEKQDFSDHGSKIIIDDEGIKFECTTKPYGFVAPNAEVWFQTFDDVDDTTGETIRREYLMTQGYLWTQQFKECEDILKEGRPQSMELDEETLNGEWSTKIKDGIDFFIINDAVFSKLCILGNDVEPCFEGASITSPAHKFSKVDNNFKSTLYSMMQDLQNYSLKGGQQFMENEIVTESVATESTDTTSVVEDTTPPVVEETPVVESEAEAPVAEENPVVVETPAEVTAESEPSVPEAQYAELENKYNEIAEKYTDLQRRYDELVEFKATIENERKTELIDRFSMLSDEEKKNVIEHKNEFSYSDIEKELSVIWARKNAENFVNEKAASKEKLIPTFTVDTDTSAVPAWITAIKNQRK